MYNYFMLVGIITNVVVKEHINRFEITVGTENYKFSFKRFESENKLLIIGTQIGVIGHLKVIDDKIYTIADKLRIMGDFESEEVKAECDTRTLFNIA